MKLPTLASPWVAENPIRGPIRSLRRHFPRQRCAMKRLNLPLLCLAVCFSLPGNIVAQQALNNEAIVKMVKAGLSEELIISMVNTQPGNYSLTADDVIDLKQSGVTDKIIAAMVTRGSAATVPSPGAPMMASPAVDADHPTIIEVGVYCRKGDQWIEVLPEVVNWKTGGTMKSFASLGVVKKDINGHIVGSRSRTSVSRPAEFGIYMPEGVAITEYQLIRLRARSDYREFRTITGGVFNQKSGAMRDMVQFEGKKVGIRLYSVYLPESLEPGEYGFIHMGSAGGAGGLSSLSMGKMYTFSLTN